VDQWREHKVYSFAHRAQTLLAVQLQEDPVRRLPCVWTVLLTTPRSTSPVARCCIAEIVRRIAAVFSMPPGTALNPALQARLGRKDAGDLHVARALSYLCRSFCSGQASELEAARECRLSAPHLSVLVKRRTGFAFTVHKRGLRILYAAHLLATTALSPQEVAYASGFRDTSALDHDFNYWFEMTPGEFRRFATVLGER
jgi:AraC-like DNA-binding protein